MPARGLFPHLSRLLLLCDWGKINVLRATYEGIVHKALTYLVLSNAVRTRGRGETGRRAGFRFQWGRPREGSSPFARTYAPLRYMPFGIRTRHWRNVEDHCYHREA